MIVGVPKESFPGERRVALTPGDIPALAELTTEVLIESGAGDAAGFSDSAYTEKGAFVLESRQEVFERSDVLLQVRTVGAFPHGDDPELAQLRYGQAVIGFADPFRSGEAIAQFARRGAELFAMEFIPRTARAQAMDALSSMALVAGYKSVVLAADRLPKFFPLMMTAAGTIAPARVFVLGAGVAGLAAMGTAKRLGAVVKAYDIRPQAADEVRSVGAEFVPVPLDVEEVQDDRGYAKSLGKEFQGRQRAHLTKMIADSDVVITAAAVPGHAAPSLVSESMVRAMRGGSVIIDLAAETGGNCELTRPGEEILKHGVTIFGPTDLPSRLPSQSSQMYGKNVTALLRHLADLNAFREASADEIVTETLITRGGTVVHPRFSDSSSSEGRSGSPDTTAPLDQN